MNLFVKMSVLYNCAKGRWFTAHTAHSWKFVYIFVLMWSSMLCFLWYHLVKQLHSCKISKKVFAKEYKMPPRQGKQFIMNLLICISLSETCEQTLGFWNCAVWTGNYLKWSTWVLQAMNFCHWVTGKNL